MGIPLIGSPAPAANYDDLLTGASQNFIGGYGNWTNSGGTLTHDTSHTYAWPVNWTGSLKFVATAADQYVECAIPGTFKAGQTYAAMLAFTTEEASTTTWQMDFGLIGTDGHVYNYEIDQAYFENGIDGRFVAWMIRWKPTANRTGVKVRMTLKTATATRTLHIGYAKVWRTLPRNGSVFVTAPETNAVQAYVGPALTVSQSINGTTIGAGGKYSGVTFGPNSISLGLESAGAAPYVALGVAPESISLEVTGAAGADLADVGIMLRAGTDYTGAYISERNATTLQWYSDTADNMMQLRHRGTGGWSVSSDGTENDRIESYFDVVLRKSGTLAVAANVCDYYCLPGKVKINEVRCHVGTAPTGADLIVDVHAGGTTIFTTQGNRPTIADGTNDDTSGTPDGGTSLAKDTVITVDVDQIGSGTAGADLYVHIRGVHIW